MNQRQLYRAWQESKAIYGQDPIHVQLVAKQAGVLAGEIVRYIMDNPTLVTIRMISQNDTIVNPIMGSEYAGMYIVSVSQLPFLTSQSVIREGDSGATVIVTLENDTFHADSETEANWTVGTGNTGLTFAQAVKNSATQCTLTFTGTVGLGTLSIMCENAGPTGNADSDVLSVEAIARSLDYSTLTDKMPAIGDFTYAAASSDGIVLDTDIAIVFTAKVKGVAGNTLIVNLIDPEVETLATTASVNGNEIDVTLASDGTDITATAEDVKDAIEANEDANAMVSVTLPDETTTLAVAGTADLIGGVNGTVAKAGKMFFANTKIYAIKSECFIYNSDGCEEIDYK